MRNLRWWTQFDIGLQSVKIVSHTLLLESENGISNVPPLFTSMQSTFTASLLRAPHTLPPKGAPAKDYHFAWISRERNIFCQNLQHSGVTAVPQDDVECVSRIRNQ
jgi:hypothetical protein